MVVGIIDFVEEGKRLGHTLLDLTQKLKVQRLDLESVPAAFIVVLDYQIRNKSAYLHDLLW